MDNSTPEKPINNTIDSNANDNKKMWIKILNLSLGLSLLLLLATTSYLFYANSSGDGLVFLDKPQHTINRVENLSATGARSFVLPTKVDSSEPLHLQINLKPFGNVAGKILAVYSNYSEFTVVGNNKELYRYEVPEDSLVRSGGYGIHFVQLPEESSLDFVQIHSFFKLPHRIDQKISPFIVGTKSEIVLHQLVKDLPIIFISFVLMLIFFVVTFVVFGKLKKDYHKYITLFHVTLFSFLLSSYLLLQQWTTQYLFINNPLIIYFMEFTVLPLMPIPVLFILMGPTSKRLRKLLLFNASLLAINALGQIILTLLGVWEFREMLFVTHALLGLSIVSISLSKMKIDNSNAGKRSAISISAWPILVGFVVGLGSYVATGRLPSSLILLLLLLCFLIIQSMDALNQYVSMREDILTLDLYKKIAITDSMTGIGNRSAYNLLLEDFSQNPKPGWVVVMDLNNLKKTNDNFGHQAGDELISFYANYFKEIIQKLDQWTLCRIGGDEFFLYSHQKDTFQIHKWLEFHNLKIKELWPHSVAPPPDFAFGAQYFDPTEQITFEEAIALADQKMYEQKFENRRLK